MSENARHLTDELLQRALTELAAGPDGTVLLTDVLRSVDSTAQVRRRPWDVRGWRGAGLLVAATLLVTAAIGSALVLASRQPEPQPSPSAPALLPGVFSASDFVAPFTYSLPPGQRAHLTRMGATTPAELYGRDGGTGSRRLRVFVVTGAVHVCPDESSTYYRQRPDQRGAVRLPAGASGYRRRRYRTDPANHAREPSRVWVRRSIPRATRARRSCSTRAGWAFGSTGLEPKLDNPSMLIIGQAGLKTIGVLISASNEDDYAAWLPIAQAYVDTFAFDTTGG